MTFEDMTDATHAANELRSISIDLRSLLAAMEDLKRSATDLYESIESSSDGSLVAADLVHYRTRMAAAKAAIQQSLNDFTLGE